MNIKTKTVKTKSKLKPTPRIKTSAVITKTKLKHYYPSCSRAIAIVTVVRGHLVGEQAIPAAAAIRSRVGDRADILTLAPPFRSRVIPGAAVAHGRLVGERNGVGPSTEFWHGLRRTLGFCSQAGGMAGQSVVTRKLVEEPAALAPRLAALPSSSSSSRSRGNHRTPIC